MTRFLYPILILVASFVLVKGADLTIKSLRLIGKSFNWSPFVLSFIFVAISTSLPEIFVGLTSALHKISQLSLGNIIGANIINLTLILGLCAIIAKKIKFEKTTKIKTTFSLLAGFYPVILALDGTLSRLDGLALFLLFTIYIIFVFLTKKKMPEKNYDGVSKNVLKNFIFLIIGLTLLIGSSEVVIRLARELAIVLELPLLLVGLILISLGTTLPELVFGLRASLKKQEEFSLGSSLGSIVTNSCLALGLAAIIFPVEINIFPTFFVGAIFFLLAIVIFSFFIRTHEELSRTEGIFLVLFFIIFLLTQFLVSQKI